ncbi:MAG TPA: caspase family protein [Bacteroidia bacterium]|nr:caspase family protein [Bacteroidia bacterium]HRS59849.1 caspase family protein [Bacteroidia bacterium]HRU68899.1 caspase family protein [Bacteroidia bacterium]
MKKTLFPLIFLFLAYHGIVFAQQTELSVQTGHTSSVRLLRFSQDGKLLASIDVSNKVNIWHLATGGQMLGFYLPIREIQVTDMAFSPDGNKLALIAMSQLFVYDIAASEMDTDFFLGFSAKSICFGSDPEMLFIAGDQTVRINLSTSEIVSILPKSSVRIQYDKSTGNLVCLSDDGEMYLIDNHLEVKDHIRHETISKLFSGKNLFLLLTHKEKMIPDFENQSVAFIQASRMWRMSYRSGKKLFTVASDYVDKNFNAISYSAKYNLLIGGNDDGKIYVVDYQKGKMIKKLKDHYSDVYDVVFSPDEEIFATCSRDRSIIIWETRTLKAVKRLYSRAFPITSLNKSRDENMLIFGNETGFTRVIDINSAVIQMRSIRNHVNLVSDVCFLPGDTLAFCCANDNKVSLISINPMGLIAKKTFKSFAIPRLFILNSLQNLGFYVDPFCLTDTLLLNDNYPGRVTVSGHRQKLRPSVSKTEDRHKTYYYKTIYYFRDFETEKLKKRKGEKREIITAPAIDLSAFDIWNPAYGHKAAITGAVILQKHHILATSSLDGTIKLWDMSSKALLVSIIPIDRDKRILITADNYYMAPRDALSGIGFKQGLQYFLPQQFDVQYNRPDIVLSRIGIASEELITAYRHAYLKRLKKMNISENFNAGSLHLPELEITNFRSLPLVTTSGNISFSVRATDELYLLDRINVYLNDVPVFGLSGIDLKEKKTRYIEQNISVDLSSGKNKIQVSVMNNQGVESLKETFYIENQKEAVKPDLYLLSIGTSEYTDSRFNLSFAAKDALDMASLFQNARNIFGKVNVKTLTNHEVTRENILEARSFLSEANIDDVVIVFAAGHGLLDEGFNYYYGTSNIDFNQPSVNGITYDELGSLLDGLKALKKLLILDTCHSGEVDKEEVEKTDEIKTDEGVIAFRSAGAGVRTKEGFGLKNINELSNQLFADLRQGSGATVISSSGGAELAMESKNWQNGLFTYCLMEGLSTRKADKNKDKKIMVSELQEYIRNRTLEISKGKQTPTSRSENISMDFRIW